MGLKGATVSGCLTGKFGLNFRPDFNGNYRVMPPSGLTVPPPQSHVKQYNITSFIFGDAPPLPVVMFSERGFLGIVFCMERAYAAVGRAVFSAQMFETVFVCIFEFFKMHTEPGYLARTGGYVQAGAFKIPITDAVKLLAQKGNIAPDFENRLTAYVDDRHMLIHRWFQQHGRPADEDAEGFTPLLRPANRVEREALDLTRQLAGYMVKFAGSEANAEECRDRIAMMFHRAHIQ